MSENDTAALPISWREKFRSHFSDTVIMDEMSYSSPQMSVSVERVQLDEKRRCQTYYIADIYIAEIENLCTAAANDSFTRYEPMGAEILAQQNDAILQINGDYCSAHTNKDFFVRNGIPYYDGVTSNDICVLYYDGSIETYSPGEYEIEEILDLHPYQVWIFGPRLLDSDGKPLENFNTTAPIAIDNPRTAVGYYEPGHYCFVVADGRQPGYASGLSMSELAELFSELGCVRAYNLDGGASSSMALFGRIINRQSDGGRPVGDVIFLAELPGSDAPEGDTQQ